jgi:hypothetical protein
LMVRFKGMHIARIDKVRTAAECTVMHHEATCPVRVGMSASRLKRGHRGRPPATSALRQ